MGIGFTTGASQVSPLNSIDRPFHAVYKWGMLKLTPEERARIAHEVRCENNTRERKEKKLTAYGAEWWSRALRQMLENVSYTMISLDAWGHVQVHGRQTLASPDVTCTLSLEDDRGTVNIHDTYGIHFWDGEIFVTDGSRHSSYAVAAHVFNASCDKLTRIITPTGKIDEDLWHLASQEYWKDAKSRVSDLRVATDLKRKQALDDKILRTIGAF